MLVGIWQLLSATGVLPATRLASPVTIAHTAYTLVTTNSPTYGTLQASLLVSAERWAHRALLGVAIAVLLAVATGLSRIGEYAFDPVLNAPGRSRCSACCRCSSSGSASATCPRILIVLLGALFPMYVNTFAGIRSVDPKLGELGQVLGLSRWELVRHVVLPGALPRR